MEGSSKIWSTEKDRCDTNEAQVSFCLWPLPSPEKGLKQCVQEVKSISIMNVRT